MKLLKPTELARLSQEELMNYIDSLHDALKSYQIVIDVAKGKDLELR